MSFMENQVLGYKSPLYGRRDMQFKIEPFDYLQSALFYPDLSNIDKMHAYGITGGIPFYLNKIRAFNSIARAVKEEFLKPNGSLFEEPGNLLKQELREPAVYNAIVTAIAGGASKLNEIATKAGEDAKKTAKYLLSLMNLRIVAKESPLFSDKRRDRLYYIADGLFRFWYRFIPENTTNIHAGLNDYVYDEKIAPFLSHYMGRIFEIICREFLIRENAAMKLPFVFDKIGRWWGADPARKEQAEIDLIAVSGDRAIFCECKWNEANVPLPALEKLMAAARLFPKLKPARYILFSKTGFTSALQKYAAARKEIRLVRIKEMLCQS